MNFAMKAMLIIIIVLLGIITYFVLPKATADFHEHVNFALYLNGERYNFSQPMYMEDWVDDHGHNDSEPHSHEGERHFAHMHSLNDGLAHLHKAGVTLGMFFDTLGIKLNATCLTLDNGSSYCSIPGKELKMYVNGQQSNDFADLPFHDLDKILITYGPGNLQQQLDSIPSDACIYSKKCPAPPGFIDDESLTCKTGDESMCSG